MSYFHVILRFETTKDFPVPLFSFRSKALTKTYAEAASEGFQSPPAVTGDDLTEIKGPSINLKRFLGRRTYQKYTIETYMASPATEVAEMNPLESYTTPSKSQSDEASSFVISSCEPGNEIIAENKPETPKDISSGDDIIRPKEDNLTENTTLSKASDTIESEPDGIHDSIQQPLTDATLPDIDSSSHGDTNIDPSRCKTEPISSSRKKKTKRGSTGHKENKPDTGQKETHTKREYTISEALKHDKQPLSLTSLARKASFDTVSDGGASGGTGTSDSRPGSARGAGAARPLSPSCIPFSSGNPSVETTEGIIHLYKHEGELGCAEEPPNSEMICFIGVPARMTSHDVIQFLAPVEGWIELIKVIRDNTPNQYMLLVKFRNHRYAMDFYKNFNNKPYNSVEMDLCHLAFVERLEAMKTEEGPCLPVPGLVELPLCPVCLERMDESVTGILTVQCNHSFHTACLAHWEDTSCPVCRFAQTPEAVADNACFECQSQESLWICLICGHVGCGRYVQQHAFKHFQETNHTYSMQLNNNRVWDYAGDNYVHRLVQNKSDGKMVEVDEGGNVVDSNEKLDSIALEYTYLVNTQMESQRHYFEEKILHVEKAAVAQLGELEQENATIREKYSEAEGRLATINKEKQTIDKKYSQLNTKLSKLQSGLAEERELNRNLQQNQAQWSSKVHALEISMAQKDQELADLREQLRDLMFYLEAGQKLAATTEVSQEELQQGHVVVGSSPTAGASARKARKKGR